MSCLNEVTVPSEVKSALLNKVGLSKMEIEVKLFQIWKVIQDMDRLAKMKHVIALVERLGIICKNKQDLMLFLV